MTQWRIYYGDGSTFDDSMGSALDAPIYGVALIAERNRHQQTCYKIHGFDWYYRVEDEWQGGDLFGVLDRLQHGLPIEALKQGRTIGVDRYKAILQRAREDKDFSP